MSLRRNIAKILAILVPVIALAIGGFWYYTVYMPQYEAERQKLLTLYTTADPADLDPARAIDTDSSRIIMNVFDRLVRYKRGTTEIEPGLAESWNITDPMTYVFNLRNNASFHDGSKFNASSVKYSFDRVIELEDVPSYLFSMINETEIVSPYKVIIHLNYDFSPFLSVLAHPVASIVSQTAVERYGEQFGKNPVGTGPFKFSSWTPGKELVLVRNDQYYRGPAKLERIVMKSILESSERREALIKGEIDVVMGGGILAADLTELEKNPDIRTYTGNSSAVEYLGFNTLVEPLDDIKIREAIAYALDYDTIIRAAFGSRAQRLSGPIPPSIFGYRETTLTQRNVTRARQLLREAGHANGFEISLTYNIESLFRRKMAEEIRNCLSEVNITVRIKGLDWSSALDEYFSMGHELMLNGFTPDYFDPDSYISTQFHSNSMVPNGANAFGFSDPAADALIEEALTTTDQKTRLQIYYEIQDIIAKALPCISLAAPSEYDCTRFNVKNWVHFPSDLVELYEVYKQ